MWRNLDGKSREDEDGSGEVIPDYDFALGRQDYERSRGSVLKRQGSGDLKVAYLALGSNMGDRMTLLESACRKMVDHGIQVKRTSALYETKPMYLEEQQNFLNGVCEVRKDCSRNTVFELSG